MIAFEMPISEFCQTGSGTTPSRQKMAKYYGGNIPWVKSGELREKEIISTEEHVTEEAINQTSLKLVPAGALLVAMYGATVGRVGLLGVEATTNQAVCHIIPDPNKADKKYLFHALQYKASELISKGVGGAQPNINQSTIKETKVYLPDIGKQKRIAAILDQADNLRRARYQSIEKLNSLSQAIFYEMFGDPNADNEIPLSDYFSEIKMGPFGSLLHKADYVENGIPLINPMHIIDGEVIPDASFSISAAKARELHNYLLKEGDIIIARRGDMGRCAVINQKMEGFLCGTGSMILRPDKEKVDPYFAADLIRSKKVIKEIEAVASGVTMLNLNSKSLNRVFVPKVEIAKQRNYFQKIELLQSKKQNIQESLKKFELLFLSLQQRAFRGEL